MAGHAAQAAPQEAFEQFMYNTGMSVVRTDDPRSNGGVLVTLIENIQVAGDGEPTIHFGFHLPAATPDLPRTAEAGDPRAWAAVGSTVRDRPDREAGEAPLRVSLERISSHVTALVFPVLEEI